MPHNVRVRDMLSLFSYPTLLSKARQFRISLVQRGMATTLYWAAFGYLRPNRFILLARDLSAGAIRCIPGDAVRLELWTAPSAATVAEAPSGFVDGVLSGRN